MAGKKQASEVWFDRWARFYERDLFSRFLRGLQQRALAALELGAGDRLLDVGCGTGAAVREAASRVEQAVGVDLSERMISRARELAEGLANVEFVQGDSEALPFADSSFTALLCTTSFHHYPDPEAAAGEMARVLAPGGRLVIGEANADRFPIRISNWLLSTFEQAHVSFYRTSELAAILERAGLRLGRAETLNLRNYMVLTARLGS
jgi:ubiquinone/menaquinone biosynthesis C-methylase UbiE